MTALIIDNRSYKIGLDEIAGLKDAMDFVLKPILDSIQDKVYWNKELDFSPVEYKSRDGFAAYSSNCGGLELCVIVPKCEEHDFNFLEFGEWDGTHYCDGTDTDNCECSYDNDGDYDAKLRVWLKFEGIDSETGIMSFYLVLSGGNGDAPYYRTKYEDTYFESEFTAKSLTGFKKEAKKHIAKLLKVMV